MPDDEHPNQLPEELARALRRATDRTLIALTALRQALRTHVHRERAEGNDLGDIQIGLRVIVARALHGLPAPNDENDPSTVTREILRWSEGFYAEQQKEGDSG